MTERKPAGTPFSSWIDAQIARAEARGDFADLPGAGRPLPRLDRPQTSYDWVVGWARREDADVAGLLPPSLALRREREQLPGRLARLPSETAVRSAVEHFNDRVRTSWRSPADGPAVVVGLVDVEEAVARWRRDRPPPPAPSSSPPREEPPRRWWWTRRRRG